MSISLEPTGGRNDSGLARPPASPPLCGIDGYDALIEAGTEIDEIPVIGGGARSTLWGRILAGVLRRPLTWHAGSEVGPTLGAARLARLAATGERPDEVCTPRPVARLVEPDEELARRLAPRLERWRALYVVLRPEMRRFDSP